MTTESGSPSKEELQALLQKERERNQETTFAEYLQACHRCISKPLTVEYDRSLTTRGSITSPAGRICPNSLRPWDFRSAQQALFDEVYRLFHPTAEALTRVFPPIMVIEDRGQQACGRPLASELDLVRHQEAEVENPVKEVMAKLAQQPGASSKFPLVQGITFENHTNTITDDPPQHVGGRPLRADQNCVYVKEGNVRSLLYVIEYKAAHKLTDSFLRAGLRPMDLLSEVVHRTTVPLDSEEKLLYDATFVSSAAARQVFEYMIMAGREYAALTNGRIKVIFRVLEDDPTTLYYCVLEPSKDAEPDVSDGLGFRFPYTAVGYQLGLTLLALQSPARSQLWRNRAVDKLRRWEMDFEEAIRTIPESERKKSPPDSNYRGPRYPLNPRSPYLLRPRPAPNSHDRPRLSVRDRSPDTSSESDTGPAHAQSSPLQNLERRKRPRTTDPSPCSSKASGRNQQTHQYCTQGCLRGLCLGSPLDPKCPNVWHHRKYSTDDRHPLSRLHLLRLVRQQVNRDPEHGCRPLGKDGLHGSLFALTLEHYCYTFVGKGTQHGSTSERPIYELLKPLQGSAIPVFLGDICLRKNVYYLSHLTPVRVVSHMSLMAWGGPRLTEDERATLHEDVEQTRIELDEAGIEHADLCARNMLWNHENRRVMFIDFGLVQVSRKRKRQAPARLSAATTRKTPTRGHKRRQVLA